MIPEIGKYYKRKDDSNWIVKPISKRGDDLLVELLASEGNMSLLLSTSFELYVELTELEKALL